MDLSGPLERLAPALGVDWIEVDAFEPHWLPDMKVRNKRAPVQEFFCPQVTWCLNGKLSRVRVPLKLTKHESFIPWLGETTWHTLDYRAMEDWIIRTIQQKALPVS